MRKILIFFILVSCAAIKHDYGPSGVTFYKSNVNSKIKEVSKLRGGKKSIKQKYMKQAKQWCERLRKPIPVLVENSEYIESYKCQK